MSQNKEKKPELIYYNVKLEAKVPATFQYKILAENPEQALEKAIQQIVPLAQTMKRKIDGLRDWATTRARPASSERNTEKLEVNEQETETKVVQTKREKEEDIF